MVRSTENRNSLLQLTKRVQIANNDREAIDTGDDSAAPDDHRHAPEESVITQVSTSAPEVAESCVVLIKGLTAPCIPQMSDTLHTWFAVC